jgi:serine/arginine repetitive matrix protein 1
MQINLTGFLNGKNARLFMSDLWELLLSAQDSVSGIPGQFLEQKKEEIKKRMVSLFTSIMHGGMYKTIWRGKMC